MPRKTPIIITLSSLAGVLFYLGYCWFVVALGRANGWGISDFVYELASLVLFVPLLAPALFGLLYFRRRPLHWTKTVLTCYVLYAFAVGISVLLLLFSDQDALAFGLPMLLLVLPACLILTIILGVRLLRARPR